MYLTNFFRIIFLLYAEKQLQRFVSYPNFEIRLLLFLLLPFTLLDFFNAIMHTEVHKVRTHGMHLQNRCVWGEFMSLKNSCTYIKHFQCIFLDTFKKQLDID